MNILFVCAEVAPFVSVGGLSQVMYFLPRALNQLGHDVRIFTPKYGKMDIGMPEGKPWKMNMELSGLRVPIINNIDDELMKKEGKDYITCNIRSYVNKRRQIHTYFLENREYYELRANVFGYMDDHIRFGLLSKGCLEWLNQLKKLSKSEDDDSAWWPDVIQCNDWHTAYLIELARNDNRYKQLLAKIPIVLTVHNFAFQGNYDYRYAKKEDIDNGTTPLKDLMSKDFQKQNALLRGLLYSDAINTVSPTHAVEVLTPEYAEGLDSTLQKVKGKMLGILNGLDSEEFDPATDPIIKVRYTEKTFTKGKSLNKIALQKLFLLPVDSTRPLLAYSGRLWRQKGIDILQEVLPHLFNLRPDVQVIILGSGDDVYHKRLMELQKLYPKQLGLHLRADFRIPRKIFAGSDLFMLPSAYEPGGIVALEALRYGSVPIVRRTGGLNDIIEDFDANSAKGNGFSFSEKSAWSFYGSIVEALTIYKQKSLWKKLVVNCLNSDFSWDRAAKEYDNWYRHVVQERKRATKPIAHPAYTTPLSS